MSLHILTRQGSIMRRGDGAHLPLATVCSRFQTFASDPDGVIRSKTTSLDVTGPRKVAGSNPSCGEAAPQQKSKRNDNRYDPGGESRSSAKKGERSRVNGKTLL